MKANMTSRAQLRRETGAVAFGHVRGRRRRDKDIQIKFFTIPEVAERLSVATRTVRRWIKADDLVVHRIGGVIRIAESDLRAFLALHREA
jgi:excisionase family DNA binding protein